MKIILKLASLILTIWILNSCSKNPKINEPIVKIYSPENNQQFLLPDTIPVSFRVEHDKQIEYIRISIDDNNLIPVSGQDFIYPKSETYEGNINLPVGVLPEDNSLPPYYIHIAVSDFSQITHTYLEINLINKEMNYEGCFLIGRPGIDIIEINYFDENYQSGLSTSINGNYSGSDISATVNMLYLITSIPDLARAFSCKSGDLIWTKEPQLPYPEFNNIHIRENVIYFSTAIGRIVGLTLNDGIQVFTTPVLPDSIPYNICSTSDYLFSDFSLRNSDSKVWVSFFKSTGNKFQLFQTNYETVSMYGQKNENLTTIFCNKNSIGSIIQFNVDENNIETQLELTSTEIHQTCKIDETDFLFSSNNQLFHFNSQNQSYEKVKDADYEILHIKFDELNNRLFILHANRVDIYSYSGITKIATIESTNLLLGIELKYGY